MVQGGRWGAVLRQGGGRFPRAAVLAWSSASPASRGTTVTIAQPSSCSSTLHAASPVPLLSARRHATGGGGAATTLKCASLATSPNVAGSIARSVHPSSRVPGNGPECAADTGPGATRTQSCDEGTGRPSTEMTSR